MQSTSTSDGKGLSVAAGGLLVRGGSGMVGPASAGVAKLKIRSKRGKKKPANPNSPTYSKLRDKKGPAKKGATKALGKFHLSLLNSGLLPRKAENGRATALLPKKPVDANKFVKHIDLIKKYDVLLRTEFQVSTKTEGHSCRHAMKIGNDEKNSHKKCLPYDFNRVVLEAIPSIPDSDYINASYIDSIVRPNAYVAAQGPNENTTSDFWRMIWQEKTGVIVMLTKVFDFIKVMCVQYWPMECHHPDTYGDIEITMLTEDNMANFVVRHFKLKKGEEEREVIHVHFTNWHCHSVPFAGAILEFRRRVRMCMEKKAQSGPVVVHCSDGCARTGTYLGIDANLELYEDDGLYDVYNYTRKLRQARKGMIETVEQYKFIYDVLLEAYTVGRTWFPVSEICQQLKYKSIKSLLTRQNEYQREYQKISKMASKFTIGDCAGGHRPENRDKNRDVAIVPPDNFRPYLTSFQSNDNTDYINAVFVDGYTRSKEYIVTEWPLPKTVQDVWSLIYDHECNSVVILCNPPASQMYPSFLPTERERKKKFGPVFTVEMLSHCHYPNIKSWIFRIHKKVVSLTELMSGVKAESKTTQIFQLLCWPQGHRVPTSTNSVVELMNMVERWRQRSNYGPVIVISTNGRSRAGVYCAANVAMEQAVQNSEVDVFQAVKTVRRHRPQLVENMTEYKYCYDLILHYVLNYIKKD